MTRCWLVLWMLVCAPALADDSILADFAKCASAPVERLEREGATIAPVSASPVTSEKGDLRTAGTEIRFRRPLRAFGLDLLGYRQDTTTIDGRARSWRWGFLVRARSRQVAFALDRVIKASGLSQEGFRREGQGWRASLGAPKSGRWREIIVDSDDEGTSRLTCRATDGIYEAFTGLPGLEKLIGLND